MKYARRPRRYTRRRRTIRRARGSGKFARRQQRSAYTTTTKKYTTVQTFNPIDGANNSGVTVSLIGGVNNSPGGAANTVTLATANKDQQLATDMRLHQFFKIRGVAIKMFFPPPTIASATPVQWDLAYSASQVLAPNLQPERLQTLAAYQTGPCVPDKSIKRYYNVARTCRRFGLRFASTDEFPAWDAPNQQLYNNQLHADEGSSVLARCYRGTNSSAGTDAASRLASLQVTYYVTYKGQKGGSSLTTIS